MDSEHFVEVQINRERGRFHGSDEQCRKRAVFSNFGKEFRCVFGDCRFLSRMDFGGFFTRERTRVEKRKAPVRKIEKGIVFRNRVPEVRIEEKRDPVFHFQNRTGSRPCEVATIGISEQPADTDFKIILRESVCIHGFCHESRSLGKISDETDSRVEIRSVLPFGKGAHVEFHTFFTSPFAQKDPLSFGFDDESGNGLHALLAKRELGIVNSFGQALVYEFP